MSPFGRSQIKKHGTLNNLWTLGQFGRNRFVILFVKQNFIVLKYSIEIYWTNDCKSRGHKSLLNCKLSFVRLLKQHKSSNTQWEEWVNIGPSVVPIFYGPQATWVDSLQLNNGVTVLNSTIERLLSLQTAQCEWSLFVFLENEPPDLNKQIGPFIFHNWCDAQKWGNRFIVLQRNGYFWKTYQ